MNVLHYRDGSTAEFSTPPTIDNDRQIVITGDGDAAEVPFSRLKAVFFLNDEQQSKDPAEPPAGSFLVVEFLDGEIIRGNAQYNPASPGFFLFPAEMGRNERVFVVASAVESIEIARF